MRKPRGHSWCLLGTSEKSLEASWATSWIEEGGRLKGNKQEAYISWEPLGRHLERPLGRPLRKIQWSFGDILQDVLALFRAFSRPCSVGSGFVAERCCQCPAKLSDRVFPE